VRSLNGETDSSWTAHRAEAARHAEGNLHRTKASAAASSSVAVDEWITSTTSAPVRTSAEFRRSSAVEGSMEGQASSVGSNSWIGWFGITVEIACL